MVDRIRQLGMQMIEHDYRDQPAEARRHAHISEMPTQCIEDYGWGINRRPREEQEIPAPSSSYFDGITHWTSEGWLFYVNVRNNLLGLALELFAALSEAHWGGQNATQWHQRLCSIE